MLISNGFYKKKIVVVTGGLGLIGSFLCEKLLQLEAKVVLIDDESKGSWKYTTHIRNCVEYRKGSLECPKFSLAATSGCDYIFHLASRPYGVKFSQRNNLSMFQFNDLINTNILNAIAQNKPRQALVVSSSCVYSDNSGNPMSDCAPVTGEPEQVNWGYGWAKRILEQKSVIYQQETRIPITVVRPFNIYGERYHWVGEKSQAIPMLTKRVMDGENPVTIWGSGNQRRNYIHAIDCACAMLCLVEIGYSKHPINIGIEETVPLSFIVNYLADVLGRKIDIVYDQTKPEGRLIKSADSQLLMKTLAEKFEWQVSLHDGLNKMINWYEKTFKSPRQKNNFMSIGLQ